MNKKVLIVSLCAFVLLATGCGKVPKLENGEEVVASIDGKQITADELFKELKKQGGTSVLVNIIDNFISDKEVKTDDIVNKYADSQVEAAKLQAKNNNQDFATLLAAAGYKSETDFRNAVILDYKQSKVVTNFLKEKVTKEEIQKYYDENIFGELTVRHILIEPDVKSDATSDEKTKAEEAALKTAKEVIEKLKKGEKFEDLVKTYSDDAGTKEDGGKYTFTKDKVVKEFWEASAKLKDGEYTKEPVKSTYGYHIIVRISQAERPKLEDSKSDIIDSIVSDKLEADDKLSAKTWVEVRKKYKLDIVDDTIKSSYDATIKSYEK